MMDKTLSDPRKLIKELEIARDMIESGCNLLDDALDDFKVDRNENSDIEYIHSDLGTIIHELDLYIDSLTKTNEEETE